jgi:hypothetical protein
LEPDGILNRQVELLEANLGRPGMRSDGLADEVSPLALQTELKKPGFKAEPFGETRENRTGRIKRTGAGHAES